MGKNGIAYPLAPEVIEMIESKRKEFMKNVGVRVSQAKFSSIIAKKLRPSIKNMKMCTKRRKRKRWS